jgi:hypothetical protein
VSRGHGWIGSGKWGGKLRDWQCDRTLILEDYPEQNLEFFEAEGIK